jgi:hypothetical protein
MPIVTSNTNRVTIHQQDGQEEEEEEQQQSGY